MIVACQSLCSNNRSAKLERSLGGNVSVKSSTFSQVQIKNLRNLAKDVSMSVLRY